MPLLIAITGNIACGKSLVGSLISDKGYPVIDSDHMVHQLYESDKEVQEELLKQFGTLDRKQIGQIAFSDSSKRKLLESILHPRIETILTSWVKENSNHKLLFNLIPLVFEAKLEKRYDKIICVTTSKNTQVERLMNRNPDLSEIEINKRIDSQLNQEEKASRSDFVIDNSASIQETINQVDNILSELLAKTL